jgi:DNA (cytosine-5)-methyltransferase 1
MLTVVELFAGQAGFSVGLHPLGQFQTVLFCEKEPYLQKLLALRFPQVPIIGDVRDVSVTTVRHLGIRRVDVVCAGFNCQPFSLAGDRKGSEDE